MQNSHPVVSVIITSYNDEIYVERAIKSVLNQTYKNFEILLVDNNSTDGTLNILREYQQKHPEFIRMLQEKRQGLPQARNCGLREAKGEWIQILDSDDELMPKKLEHDLSFATDKEIGFIASNRVNFHAQANGEIRKEFKYSETKDIWRALLLFSLCSTNSCLLKRDVLLDLNGWNESWSSVEDYEMYFRILKKGVKVAFSPFVDSIVHKRPNSMSRSTDPSKFATHLNFVINARLMIVAYMEANGLLTKDLKRQYQIDLYFKLLRWKHKAPALIEQKLEELNLKVPVGLRMRHKASSLKSIVRKEIKKIFLS